MPPIGVFDSGLGGLTVVAALQALLLDVRVVYLGDSLHAPYGARSAEEITALSVGQTRFLVEHFGCKVVVVACNTATAAAVPTLRAAFPEVHIVGMEPAVKPAAAATKTRKVGVLATVGTLQSARFAALLERYGGGAHFLTYSCPGWVEAVEAGALDTPETKALVARYVEPLIGAGVDTLVLGCTHFPALKPLIARVAGPKVTLIDTGAAVARHVSTLLPLPSLARAGASSKGDLLFTTGEPQRFARGAAAILGRDMGEIGALYWSHGELFEYAKSGRSGEPGPAPRQD